MAAALVAGTFARYMSSIPEGSAPEAMIRWIADNSEFVDSVILPERTPDTVRQLKLASHSKGIII